jgi:hypothetical protein
MVVWHECDGTRSGYFPAQYVALVGEPESEFESHPDLGQYVTVIEEPEPEVESRTEFAPVVNESIVAVALYECVRCPFLRGRPSDLGYFGRVAMTPERRTSCRCARVIRSPRSIPSRIIGSTVATSMVLC